MGNNRGGEHAVSYSSADRYSDRFCWRVLYRPRLALSIERPPIGGLSFHARNQLPKTALGGVDQSRGNAMNKIAIAAFVAALTMSAVAQAAEFYVVQDVKTKKCTIVDKKPTTTTEVTVLGSTVYKTRTEAETGMKTVKVCTSN
jgi:hypothetical protein